jgi:hypothetical protein
MGKFLLNGINFSVKIANRKDFMREAKKASGILF